MSDPEKPGLLARFNAWLTWTPAQSFGTLFLVSVLFWALLRHGRNWPTGLFVSLSLASFMAGCLIGFLFSSYDEEAATVGKVRDWLVGGLTGITVVKFKSIENLLLSFAGGPGPQPFAMVVGVSVTYAVCGFFAMFLQRELILNVLLAASRRKRGLLEGGKEAGAVARELVSNAPLNLLLGQFSSDDLIGTKKKAERDAALAVLNSPDVTEYLKQAEAATKDGMPPDWDVVSKVATLQYYRIYAVKPEEHDDQVLLAQAWLQRALNMYPGHPDFEAKYADALNEQGKNREAIDTLRRVLANPQAPAFVMQWLAVFLLRTPGNEEESIRLSRAYFKMFPDEHDSYFNIARAYAGMYNTLHDKHGAHKDEHTREKLRNYRELTIENLREALDAQSKSERMQNQQWLKTNEDYANFKELAEFKKLVGEGEVPVVNVGSKEK